MARKRGSMDSIVVALILSSYLSFASGQLGSPCTTSGGSQGICSPPASNCITNFATLDEYLSSGCDAGDGSQGLCCPEQISSRFTPSIAVSGGGIQALPRFSQADRLENVALPEISQNSVRQASDEGENVIRSRSTLERNLRSQGIFIESRSSGAAHQAFFGSNRKALEVARNGFAFLEASKKLAQDFELTSRQGSDGLRRVSGEGTSLNCPEIPRCDRNAKYRTADGSCNNLQNPIWGKSFTAFDRVLKPAYADGINLPRQASDGGPLPSARKISSIIAIEGDSPSNSFTHLLMQFAQFLDHDFTLLALTKAENGIRIRCCGAELDRNPDLRHPECFQIPIPRNDPFYSRFNEDCMEFVRSAAAPPNDCKLGPRQQINQLTSYIDASMIYGSTEEEAHELRSLSGGRLKSQTFRNKELLPLDKENVEECNRQRRDQFCFKAGDERVNEQIDLTVMHTIWLREHNRIVQELQRLNPHWNDEKLYQEGRKIVGAIWQHMVYNEYLPLILGYQVMKIFDILPTNEGVSNTYDPQLNPSVFNAFGGAAFRYGHTLVQDKFNVVAAGGRRVDAVPVSDTFNNPFRLYRSGVMDGLLRGLTSQPAQSFDSFVTPQLTTLLFKQPGSGFGLDLVALNIQRGRDHGLPSYNEYRELCGMRKLTSFNELHGIMKDGAATRIINAGYRSVDDIDLFIAGISEKAYPGSLLGPTFACLIGGQFAKLKHGDRFFYTNGGQNQVFTPAQLAAIRTSSFARVICNNADNIQFVQPIPFLQAGVWNSRTSCESPRIPKMDLSAWQEARSGPKTTRRPDDRYLSESDDIDEGYKDIVWGKKK